MNNPEEQLTSNIKHRSHKHEEQFQFPKNKIHAKLVITKTTVDLKGEIHITSDSSSPDPNQQNSRRKKTKKKEKKETKKE